MEEWRYSSTIRDLGTRRRRRRRRRVVTFMPLPL
jgi:hypothetical protein